MHSHRLWCLIKGQASPFGIWISSDINVCQLKNLVLEEGFSPAKRNRLKDLVLKQIKAPIAVGANDRHLHHVESLAIDAVVELTDPARLLSDIFPDPPVGHLHILVVTDTFDQSIAQNIYDTLWGKPLDPFLGDVPTDVAGTAVQRYYTQALIDATQLFHLQHRENILLIREEYNTLYNVLQSWSHIDQDHGGGAIVTGQPGIGKTCFLFFILFQRLSAALPTALQIDADVFYLFTSQGASVHSSKFRCPYKLPRGTWALSDPNDTIGQPCNAFLEASMDVWIVQVSSPQQSRWRQWEERRGAKIYVMDCISPAEMVVFGTLLNLDVKKLLQHMMLWGPSARICIDLERGCLDVKTWSEKVEMAAKQFVVDPASVMDLVCGLDFTDDVPLALLALRPNGLTAKERGTAKANIPTRHLLGYVMRALAAFDISEKASFFIGMNSQASLRCATRWCFEKFVHVRLITHSSSSLEATATNHDPPRLLIPVCKTFHPLDTLNILMQAKPDAFPVYWRPTSTQFTTLDAIIFTEREVILLQTIFSRGLEGLGVKPAGLDEVLRHLPTAFRKRQRICLVFIASDQHTALCLRNQRLSWLSRYDLTVYSGVCAVREMLPLSARQRDALEEVLDKDSIMHEIFTDSSYERHYGEEAKDQIQAVVDDVKVGTARKRKNMLEVNQPVRKSAQLLKRAGGGRATRPRRQA